MTTIDQTPLPQTYEHTTSRLKRLAALGALSLSLLSTAAACSTDTDSSGKNDMNAGVNLPTDYELVGCESATVGDSSTGWLAGAVQRATDKLEHAYDETDFGITDIGRELAVDQIESKDAVLDVGDKAEVCVYAIDNADGTSRYVLEGNGTDTRNQGSYDH